MSAFPYRENLSDEQAEAVEKAAFLVVKARAEAASVLAGAGVEPVPEAGWFGSPCGAILPPPPQNHRCGCRNYKGDGGPCLSEYKDFLGPDIGAGAPIRTCEHLPSDHLET